MNSKQALRELLNLIREYRGIREFDGSLLPDFVFNEGFETDAKSTPESITAIFEGFIDSATEIDSHLNPIETSVDTLAYYVTFRFRPTGSGDLFGVHLNLPVFLRLCKKLKWDTKKSASEIVTALWKFVWTHELNHFDCDVASAIIEYNNPTIAQQGRYSKPGFFCPHEESLGQTRALKAIKRKHPEIAEALEMFYSGMPDEYSDFNFRHGDVEYGIEDVVPHSANQDCAPNKPAILVRALLGRKTFGEKALKVFFHYRTVVSDGVFKLSIPKDIRLDKHAEKQLEKIYRGNKSYKKKFQKAESLLRTNPHHPSLRTTRFEGVDRCYEARIDGGDRILFVANEKGEFIIKEVGKDLYRH